MVDKNPYHAARVIVLCHAMPFSARALKKKIFFDVDVAVKTNRNALNRALNSYCYRVRVITCFPDIFFVLFLYFFFFSYLFIYSLKEKLLQYNET